MAIKLASNGETSPFISLKLNGVQYLKYLNFSDTDINIVRVGDHRETSLRIMGRCCHELHHAYLPSHDQSPDDV